MAQQTYNPKTLPWLSIVNYPACGSTAREVALVIEKVKEHYREFGAESMSVSLEQGVRLDKARPELLLAVIYASSEWGSLIRGWELFKSRVDKSLIDRGFKNVIGSAATTS
jgi:hypothetical protein